VSGLILTGRKLNRQWHQKYAVRAKGAGNSYAQEWIIETRYPHFSHCLVLATKIAGATKLVANRHPQKDRQTTQHATLRSGGPTSSSRRGAAETSSQSGQEDYCAHGISGQCRRKKDGATSKEEAKQLAQRELRSTDARPKTTHPGGHPIELQECTY